jgi:Cu-Zn family superoxide dismutase
MQRKSIVLLGAISLGLITGCASMNQGSAARAEMVARSGSTVSGTVTFTPVAGGLQVNAIIAGLTPGEHGFHIHEAGDCSAADASSAKGHFNPTGKAHGHHGGDTRHAGDMPNLIANAQGQASFSARIMGLELSGNTGIIGRSVVIHADPDDYKSQPAGNSGKRVACGVVAVN